MNIFYKSSDDYVHRMKRGDVILLNDPYEFCGGYIVGFTNVSKFKDITSCNLRYDFMSGKFRLERIEDEVYIIILNSSANNSNKIPLCYFIRDIRDVFFWNKDELNAMMELYKSHLPGKPERLIHVWMTLNLLRKHWKQSDYKVDDFIKVIFNESQRNKDGYYLNDKNFAKAWDRCLDAGIFYVNDAD